MYYIILYISGFRLTRGCWVEIGRLDSGLKESSLIFFRLYGPSGPCSRHLNTEANNWFNISKFSLAKYEGNSEMAFFKKNWCYRLVLLFEAISYGVANPPKIKISILHTFYTHFINILYFWNSIQLFVLRHNFYIHNFWHLILLSIFCTTILIHNFWYLIQFFRLQLTFVRIWFRTQTFICDTTSYIAPQSTKFVDRVLKLFFKLLMFYNSRYQIINVSQYGEY